MTKQKVIHEAIDAERKRQDILWGEQNHDAITWMNILLEEVGEAAKCVNDFDVKVDAREQYEVELIQVAAVAVAMIESYRRNGF